MKLTTKAQITSEVIRQLSPHGDFAISSAEADEDTYHIHGAMDGKELSLRVTGALPHPASITAAVHRAISEAF